MPPAGRNEDERIINHLSSWLRPQIIGCQFARYLIGKQGILFPLVKGDELPELVEALEDFLITRIEQPAPVVAIFPDIRTQELLLELLIVLGTKDRWNNRVLRVPKCPDLVLQTTWLTPTRHTAFVQGLAPFPTMPPVRRAPYVAMVLWPGGNESQFWTNSRRTVSLADTKMPEDLSEDHFDNLWEGSVSGTKEILTGHHYDIRGDLKKVSFILDGNLEERAGRFGDTNQLGLGL